jgi:hypothetical protein
VTVSTRPQLVTCSWSAYRRQMGTCVRISLGVPRGVRLSDPRYTDRAHWPYVAQLAPRRSYWNEPADVFARMYLEQIHRLADEIDQALGAIPAENGGLVLCCFERRITGPECHRRLAARFLATTYGVEIVEMDPAPGGCR